MHLIWVLFATPLVSLLYSAYLIGRNGKSKYSAYVIPLPASALPAPNGVSIMRKAVREVRWIKAQDLDALVNRVADLIVLDLRPSKEDKSLLFSNIHVLSITPNRLVDVLRQLPPETTIVLFGATDICTSILWIIRGISGFAPVYVLNSDVHSEVA